MRLAAGNLTSLSMLASAPAGGLVRMEYFLYALTRWSRPMTGANTLENQNEREAAELGLVPLPWDAGHGRPLGAFIETVIACLRHPGDFFHRVPHTEDRWTALGFALIMHVLGFSAAAGWHLVFEREELTLALIRVVIAPLWVLLSVWVGSEIMHGLLGILRGVRYSRAITHRAVAYCYATAILGVIPIWGLRVGLAAAIVYQIIALRQAHRAPTWKAVTAVLLTWGLLIGGVVVLALGGEPADVGTSP